MAVVLTNGKGFYHSLVYVLEYYRIGIGLLPPWGNELGPASTVAENGRKIRVAATRTRLLEERAQGAFASLVDFHGLVRPAKEEMELLMSVGVFDGFGRLRTAQLWEIQRLCSLDMDHAWQLSLFSWWQEAEGRGGLCAVERANAAAAVIVEK